jgi:hypothetical protein
MTLEKTYDFIKQEFLSKYPTDKIDKKAFSEMFEELYPQDKTAGSVEYVFISFC